MMSQSNQSGALPKRMRAFGAEIPKNLSIAWLAVSVLYFFGEGDLPEPKVAFLLATGVGLICAALAVATPPAPTRVSASAVGRVPEPLPDGREARQLGTFTDGHHRQVPPYPPAPAPPPGRRQAREVAHQARTPLKGPRRDQETRTPGQPPPAAPVITRPPVTVKLDYDSYSGTDALEIQCPHCGSFEGITNNDGTYSDPNCRQTWLSADSPPDVVIRSWFSL